MEIAVGNLKHGAAMAEQQAHRSPQLITLLRTDYPAVAMLVVPAYDTPRSARYHTMYVGSRCSAIAQARNCCSSSAMRTKA
jgi:hypothetical protein